jgi:hypothetical protein
LQADGPDAWALIAAEADSAQDWSKASGFASYKFIVFI